MVCRPEAVIVILRCGERGETGTVPGPALATWPCSFPQHRDAGNTGPEIEGRIIITTSQQKKHDLKVISVSRFPYIYEHWKILTLFSNEIVLLTPSLCCPSIVIISFRLSFTDTFSQVTCFWVRVKENRLKYHNPVLVKSAFKKINQSTKDTVMWTAYFISGHLDTRNDEIYGRLQVTDDDYETLWHVWPSKCFAAEEHPVRIWIGPRKSSYFCRTAK